MQGRRITPLIPLHHTWRDTPSSFSSILQSPMPPDITPTPISVTNQRTHDGPASSYQPLMFLKMIILWLELDYNQCNSECYWPSNSFATTWAVVSGHFSITHNLDLSIRATHTSDASSQTLANFLLILAYLRDLDASMDSLTKKIPLW